MTPNVPVARRAKVPVSDAWVRGVVAAALLGAKAKGADEVGVVFVGDREMTSLNASYRGKRKTTDVLSFGNDGIWDGEGGSGLLGDIVVSVPQVKRQAKAAGKSLRSELALMLVHGTLHLLGHDHVTLKDEKRMFSLQDRILKPLGHA